MRLLFHPLEWSSRTMTRVIRATTVIVALAFLFAIYSVITAQTASHEASLAAARAQETATAANKTARLVCVRSRRFGRLNYAEHVKEGVYSRQDLKEFLATIPPASQCPAVERRLSSSSSQTSKRATPPASSPSGVSRRPGSHGSGAGSSTTPVAGSSPPGTGTSGSPVLSGQAPTTSTPSTTTSTALVQLPDIGVGLCVGQVVKTANC